MKALTCAATRRRLHAFHDHELDVRDQIAVAAHLEWCEECAEQLRELRAIQMTLNALAPRSVARLIGAVPPPPEAMAVARLVDGDPVDPGAEARLAAEPVNGAEDAQEDFLGQVERFVAVAEQVDG